MKQLTCEMCGSTDLVKQDGVFVCQSCGCKYSIEEAKKMMVEGTVEVQGTVKVDASNQVKTLLQRAEVSLADGLFSEAYGFAEQVLNLDAECGKAYLIEVLCKLYVEGIEQISSIDIEKRYIVEEIEKKSFNSIYKQAIKYLEDDLKILLQNAIEELKEKLKKLKEEQEKPYIQVINALNLCGEPVTATHLITMYSDYLGSCANEDGIITNMRTFRILKMLVDNLRVKEYFEGKKTLFWTLEGVHNKAHSLLKNATTLEDLNKAEELFKLLEGYEDVKAQLKEIENKRNQLNQLYQERIQKERQAEQERLLKERQAEQERLLKEKKLKEQEEIKMQQYRSKGVCQYCGGTFKGLFIKTCSICWKEKDY